MKIHEAPARFGRRQFACWLAATTTLPLLGCGGGSLDPLGVLDNGGVSDDKYEPADCNLDGKIDLKDDCNRDGVLDEMDGKCCPRGGGSTPATNAGTLYDAYLALQSGMTKAQVIALVPVSPSQGADTNQVLWVKGEEALGVEFKGSGNTNAVVFAQWGLSIAAGGRTESRRF